MQYIVLMILMEYFIHQDIALKHFTSRYKVLILRSFFFFSFFSLDLWYTLPLSMHYVHYSSEYILLYSSFGIFLVIHFLKAKLITELLHKNITGLKLF